ncbi:hypothetical protein K450DRAFT_221034 [Umbelopsis ramanniana AG]|uniref:Secreted protein n=1 Tax=Umbelopsis ramanniana AG TaxID=1314678 RepID=A0AAD5EIF4_UMBRA|nr:uncharacterized protein K450DRAFT_221034 [Umbelopsis ramanniana AG]KAI8584002.1 hypothetical protein K450DRAFT_221034 [Umbelopsis ramanniana AG]
MSQALSFFLTFLSFSSYCTAQCIKRQRCTTHLTNLPETITVYSSTCCFHGMIPILAYAMVNQGHHAYTKTHNDLRHIAVAACTY